ncbi:MAG: hypothetical protein V2A61_04625 [Calditrichota bacterium]
MKNGWKPERLCHELEEVAEKLFVEIRRDQGSFQTGACVLQGRKILLINSRQPIDERISCLAREIARSNFNFFYLKPAVRAEVERYAALEAR